MPRWQRQSTGTMRDAIVVVEESSNTAVENEDTRNIFKEELGLLTLKPLGHNSESSGRVLN